MIVREMKVHLNSEVPIIDNEISNDISNPSGQWDYEKGDIICCAVLYGDVITIILREHKDDLDSYKEKLKEILDKLPTMYAFNFNMEKGNFLGFLGKRYFIEEIKPFKGRGKSKQWFFEELVKDKKIYSEEVPEDPIEDDSGKVLDLYEKKDYETIIVHNMVDVLKQYHIWKHKHYLIGKYKNKINSQGWFTE